MRAWSLKTGERIAPDTALPDALLTKTFDEPVKALAFHGPSYLYVGTHQGLELYEV